MGIFDFLENAGRKIADGDDRNAAAPAAQPNPAAQQAQIAEARERRRELAILKLINDMGFRLQNLVVNVEDDTVTLTGTARSQEEREKVVLLVGNTQGIARVDDRLAVATQASAPTGTGPAPGTVKAATAGGQEPHSHFYTVEKGDTLSRIAKQFYGDANAYMRIFEANQPMLEDPDEIYPGQVLRIPGAGGAQASSSPRQRPGARA